MIKTDRGFVLSLQEYREHDALVRFLGESSGLNNYILPGYYKTKSKQTSLGLEYSYVEYQANFKKNRLNRIISGKLINGFIDYRSDLPWMLDMNLAAELVEKLYDKDAHNDIYKTYYSLAFSSEKARINRLVALILKFIGLHGLNPILDHCVYCDSGKINSFSIKDGGFLCLKHSRKKDEKFLLINLYKLFKFNDYEAKSAQDPVLSCLIDYLSYHTDNYFNAWHLRKYI